MKKLHYSAALAVVSATALFGAAAQAASITAWNTGNVDVGATPTDGTTGFSTVYDRPFPDAAAITNGRIAFTPPEAISPGIKVEPEVYTQGGPAGITLSGCLMTSNPAAVCTSGFQSGKRIKQQMTGFGPVDLVFDIANDQTESTYQVFHRLINQTTKALDGFAVELGFGVGDGFTAATAADGLRFSSLFRASPTGSGPVSTQFPFGLFGDATTNPNFNLDGFFAPERTGFDVTFGDLALTSAGIFGPYDDLFGPWVSQESVPTGAFWDNDGDASTEALLMAWLTPEGLWDRRRAVDGSNAISVTPEFFQTYEALLADLGLGSALFQDDIEDLANLNLNFAIALGDLGNQTSFTLRTTVFEAVTTPVPLPAGAPLLIGAVGVLAALRRRKAGKA